MMYVVRNAKTGEYRQNDYLWTKELTKAAVYKTRRTEDSWWFQDYHQLVPVTITLAEEV